ncbi:MAG: phytanoyl-CoA dioxygenase family protein [Symploca sp. SIO1B1]|nr:phytanoyl-CoA dioxygenase family protein [Symploca sp. SIO1B1]
MVLQSIDGKDPKAQSLAVMALEQHGAVVVRQIVDISFLCSLKARMDQDTKRLLEFCEKIGGNPRDAGHLQQSPPTHPPYLHQDILAHPLIWGIAREILGSQASLMFYSGNTNCPGSTAQAVHIDQPREHLSGQATSALNINIPVQNIGPENGSIELWPGTHILPTKTRVSSQDLDQRREVVPPIQPRVCAGDVLLRNPRTWHRGIPNLSQEYRHMLTVLIHRQPKGPVAFDFSAREFVEVAGVPLNVDFRDYTQEYLFEPTRWLSEASKSKEVGSGKQKSARPLVDI